MMPLTGDDAENLLNGLLDKAKLEREERFVTAKADAHARGKEPFYLAKLESIACTAYDGRLGAVEERQARLEEMYYVHHPDVMTLAEFAKIVDELSKW
jgi:hypothetical protein